MPGKNSKTDNTAPRKRAPVYEQEADTEPSRGYTPLLAAIVFFAIALGMGYIVIKQPESLTAAVDALRAFGGGLFWLTPVWMLWAAWLCLRVELGRRTRIIDAAAQACALLGVFAIASLTAAPRLEISIHTYGNFVVQFARQRKGGGLLGAVIAYPLSKLGPALGSFAVIVFCILLFTASGTIPRLVMAIAARVREYREEAEACREAEADEDYDLPEEEIPRRGRAKAALMRDPLNATIQSGTRARQPKRRADEPLPEEDAPEPPKPRAKRTSAAPAEGRLFNGHGAEITGAEDAEPVIQPARKRRANPFDVESLPAEDGYDADGRKPSRKSSRNAAASDASYNDYDADGRKPSRNAAASDASYDDYDTDGRKPSRAALDESEARKPSDDADGETAAPRKPFSVADLRPKRIRGRFEEPAGVVGEDDIASEEDLRGMKRRVGGPEAPVEEVNLPKRTRRVSNPEAEVPEHLDVVERAGNGDIRIRSVHRNPANLFEVHEEPSPVEATEPEPEAPKPARAPQKPKPSFFDHEDLTIQPDAYDFPETPEPKKPKAKPAEEEDEHKFVPPQLITESGDYIYPSIDLLTKGESVDNTVHRERDMEKAQLLEETLRSFGIQSQLTGIAHGPAVTRFELAPAPGVKVSRITSLTDDIALNLAARSIRIEAPIPGKAAVGVEIPNDKIEMVRLRDVLESSEAINHASKIAVGLGKDNAGRYIVADLAKMPHTLIAGQTGSGKSVCINCIIMSILYRAAPEEVKLILVDPKMVELSIYNDIPHLICPVVTDPKKAASALQWAVTEMTDRYKRFAERGVRDIKGYNRALKPDEPMMPKIVIIIDELADLMMLCRAEVEDSICRLAQLARACGIHLVIATQRPSVNVVTGIIKANIPSRIAFSVASQTDSRTMLDHGGAEQLLGNGDMLFAPSGINKPMRVQGAWVSDDEVHSIVEYIKMTSHTHYDEEMIETMEAAARDAESQQEHEEDGGDLDPRLMEAVDIACDAGSVSTSHLQRRMRMGYARAGRCVDVMSQLGIVSQQDGSKPRTVLVTREEAHRIVEEAMKG